MPLLFWRTIGQRLKFICYRLCTLDLQIVFPPVVKISIRTLSGQTITLEVPDSNSIEEVTSKALSIDGITIVLPEKVRRTSGKNNSPAHA